MKSLPLAFAVGVLSLFPVLAQEADKPKEVSPPPAEPSSEPAAAPDLKQADTAATGEAKDMAALEAKFKATLTKATMSGRWCLIKDGQLTPEQPEKYTIVGVNKLFGERWLIRARIQYGGKDITAPVPVRVKWAGDTPVITVDDVGIPGSSTYSARVVIYDDSYAGTWSGGNLRGLLSGMITREKE